MMGLHQTMSHRRVIVIFSVIFLLAAVLRLCGVFYGLPLWLIADEPQFVLTATSMVQLPTLLISGVAHYSSVLYNPPYIVYLLLLPYFVLIKVVDPVNLAFYAFVVGRLMTVAIGMVTVWMVSKAARRMFPSAGSVVPLLAAYLFATSILSIGIFATVRHWSWATFLVAWGLMICTDPKRSAPIRLSVTMVLAGIAMGINQAAGIILMIIAALWLFVVERTTVRSLVSSRWVYGAVSIGAFFTFLPFVLYPGSLRGVRQEQWPILTQNIASLMTGLVSAPVRFFNSLTQSEPVLVLLAATGLVFLCLKARRIFWFCLGVIASYIAVFHFLYFFEHRFLSLLLPLLAILAAFGAWSLARALPKSWGVGLLVLVLAVPLIVSVRFSYLLAHNDSRTAARAWFEDNIPARSWVMTWASLMRLSVTPQTITEKSHILGELNVEDPDERSEYLFPTLAWGRVPFHALNLSLIQKDDFYANLVPYACAQGYEYLMVETDELGASATGQQVAKLIEGANRIASFGVSDHEYSVTATRFRAPPWQLFSLPLFGPRIDVYKIARAQLCGSDVSVPLDPPMQTLLEITDTVPGGELLGFPFALDAKRVVHENLAIIGTNQEANILVLTKEGFEKMSQGEKPVAIQLNSTASTLELAQGDYVLAIVAPTKDFHFHLLLTAE